jgi:hypothetical protein
MENQIVIISVMVTYITLLILWGIYNGRKVKTGADFAIAGRILQGKYSLSHQRKRRKIIKKNLKNLA